jgi:hypothetical protein
MRHADDKHICTIDRVESVRRNEHKFAELPDVLTTSG